jgi:hypothetical protein
MKLSVTKRNETGSRLNRLSENYFPISEMGNFALYGPQMGQTYHYLLYLGHQMGNF